MPRLKIAYVAYYDLGNQTAAREHIIQVVNGFATAGHKVTLLVPNRDDVKLNDTVEVLEVKGPVGLLFDKNLPAVMETHVHNVDVLYVRDYMGAHRIVEWATKRGIPLYLEHNGLFHAEVDKLGWKTRLLFALDKRLWLPKRLEAAKTNFVVARAIGQFLAKKYGLSENRFVHIPNGVDLNKFRPASDRGLLRHRLNLPEDALIVGYVGSMYPWHHLVDLVRGFEILASSLKDVFLLIGGSGMELERVRMAMAESPYRNRMRLVSPLPVNQSPHYIAALDVGIALMSPDVAPYCWQVKVNHYAASGVVSVMTYANGLEELFQNDVAVGIAKPQPALIAETIANLLEGDKFIKMGAKARKFAEENLGWNKIVQKILNNITSDLLDN